MEERPRSLSDLASEADVSVRTIRYYITLGLLPGAVGQGPAARYTNGHLARLRLIKRFQAQDVPLAKIRAQLESLDDEQVERLADEQTLGRSVDDQPAPGTNALDYIRGVLGDRPATQALASSAPEPRMLASNEFRPAAIGPTRREIPESYPPRIPPRHRQPGADRSTWERISIAPDIELHVRRPLDRRTNKQLDALIQEARRLFEGGPR